MTVEPLRVADAKKAVVNPAADFPHVIERCPAVVVDQDFVRSAMSESFFLLHFVAWAVVDPNVETGHIVIVDLHAHGFAADVDYLPLIERNVLISAGSLLLFEKHPFV